MGCMHASAQRARCVTNPSDPDCAHQLTKSIVITDAAGIAPIRMLSDDCLLVVLSFLRLKHVCRTLSAAVIFHAAGRARVPGAGGVLYVPQDFSSLHRTVHVFLVHAYAKGWTEIRLGPGRFHLPYSDAKFSEPTLVPVPFAFRSRTNSSEMEWPSYRRCRHLLIQNAHELVISGTIMCAKDGEHILNSNPSSILTEVCGQIVLHKCTRVTLRRLRLTATRSGLLSLQSSVLLDTCVIDLCERSGILTTKGSRVTAKHCIISENRQFGICAVDRGSWARLSACDISSNGLNGAYACASAHIDVCGVTTVSHNGNYGLYASSSGVVLVQADKDGQSWAGVTSCGALFSDLSAARGVRFFGNTLGNKCSVAGGRILEYCRANETTRPYAVRVVIQSTPDRDMRQYHGLWGTLEEKCRDDDFLSVKLDDSGVGNENAEEFTLLVHRKNVIRKEVLSERVLTYDVRACSLRRFAFHL